MKLTLAKGLAVGLEFKMGSEILRTVIVREWEEIIVVAGIIGLRAALNFLIHWEIHEESKTWSFTKVWKPACEVKLSQEELSNS